MFSSNQMASCVSTTSFIPSLISTTVSTKEMKKHKRLQTHAGHAKWKIIVRIFNPFIFSHLLIAWLKPLLPTLSSLHTFRPVYRFYSGLNWALIPLRGSDLNRCTVSVSSKWFSLFHHPTLRTLQEGNYVLCSCTHEKKFNSMLEKGEKRHGREWGS